MKFVTMVKVGHSQEEGEAPQTQQQRAYKRVPQEEQEL